MRFRYGDRATSLRRMRIARQSVESQSRRNRKHRVLVASERTSRQCSRAPEKSPHHWRIRHTKSILAIDGNIVLKVSFNIEMYPS